MYIVQVLMQVKARLLHMTHLNGITRQNMQRNVRRAQDHKLVHALLVFKGLNDVGYILLTSITGTAIDQHSKLVWGCNSRGSTL